MTCAQLRIISRVALLCAAASALACGGGDQSKADGSGAAPAEASAAGDEAATPPGDTGEVAAEAGEDGDGGETGDGGEGVDPPAGETDGAQLPGEPQVVEVTADTKIGVEVCDAYIAAYVACIEKMPEDEREAARKEIGEQVAAWKQTVDGGGAVAAVEIGCKTATARAKKAREAHGCAFGEPQ